MTSAAIFTLLRPSVLRNCQKVSQVIPIESSKLPLPPSLRFHRYSSSALTIDSDASIITDGNSSVNSAHPWSEWVDFVDRLKVKGYFSKDAAVSGGGGGVDKEGLAVYTDMKLVKDACLSFSRDRFDIFKSLSKRDIQTIVEKGCPNLLRKVVNSAKRLRAYLGLDEGEVCGSCELRGSCDRAYILVDESEAAARTVDIIRILLFYALDPPVISGAMKSPGSELVETSARKLLSQLVELGETPPDPELPKPAAVTSQKKQPRDLLDNESSKDGELKPGDWVCASCSFMNFARNVRCLKCKSEGPKNASFGVAVMKKGDWNCPKCSFMNFASNRKCFRCQESRPQRELRPGDWECPSCDFVNYARNFVCKKCNLDRPRESSVHEQTWTRPY